ncbi:MAG: hypothetical protein AVDCRST_MAG73-891, partial [uncultured Thermomicrobiales bacterium]
VQPPNVPNRPGLPRSAVRWPVHRRQGCRFGRGPGCGAGAGRPAFADAVAAPCRVAARGAAVVGGAGRRTALVRRNRLRGKAAAAVGRRRRRGDLPAPIGDSPVLRPPDRQTDAQLRRRRRLRRPGSTGGATDRARDCGLGRRSV